MCDFDEEVRNIPCHVRELVFRSSESLGNSISEQFELDARETEELPCPLWKSIASLEKKG